MHFQKSISAVIFATVVVVQSQVTLKLYDGISGLEEACDPDFNFASCTNLAIATCCVSNGFISSIQASGLDTGAVPDILSVFTHPNNLGCASSCDTGGGDNTECVDCDDQDTELGGGAYFVFNSKRDIVISRSVEATVYADQIGIFDTAIGTHRLFNIAAGIPSDAVDELYAAVRNGTKAADLNSALFAYEV